MHAQYKAEQQNLNLDLNTACIKHTNTLILRQAECIANTPAHHVMPFQYS